MHGYMVAELQFLIVFFYLDGGGGSITSIGGRWLRLWCKNDCSKAINNTKNFNNNSNISIALLFLKPKLLWNLQEWFPLLSQLDILAGTSNTLVVTKPLWFVDNKVKCVDRELNKLHKSFFFSKWIRTQRSKILYSDNVPVFAGSYRIFHTVVQYVFMKELYHYQSNWSIVHKCFVSQIIYLNDAMGKI